MARYAAILAVAWMLVGCRAPAPSFNVLAPYGSATVPPPRTGAVGTAGQYYAPTTPAGQSPTTIPATPMSSTLGVAPQSPPAAPPVSFMGATRDEYSAETTRVAQASYESGTTGQSHAPATTVTGEVLPPDSTASADSATTGSSSTLQLNGMRVNDATQLSEPERFNPASEPVNIASLPPATAHTPSFLRFISPKSGTSSATPAPSQSTTSSSAWQAR